MSTEESAVDEEQVEEIVLPTPEQPESQCPFCAGTGERVAGFDGETEACDECNGEGTL